METYLDGLCDTICITYVGDIILLSHSFEELVELMKHEIFKNFQVTTCNELLQSPSPSLTGFNIQASVMKIVTSERRESP